MNNLGFIFSTYFLFPSFFPNHWVPTPSQFYMLRFSCLFQTDFGENYSENKPVIYLRRKGQKKRTRRMWISEHFPGPAISCSLHCYEEIRLLERAVTGWVPPPPQVRYPALCPLLHGHTHFMCSWSLGILLSPDLTSLSTSPPSLIFLMLLGIPMYQG